LLVLPRHAEFISAPHKTSGLLGIHLASEVLDKIARGIDIADQFIETKLLEWELEREWGLRNLE